MHSAHRHLPNVRSTAELIEDNNQRILVPRPRVERAIEQTSADGRAPSGVPSYGPFDIQLPFASRRGDARPAGAALGDPEQRLHRVWDVLPYPVSELLAAEAGVFDLKVDVKHDDRVVGSWSIECHPPSPTGLLASHARAELYVCGSAAGNPRETGAFLAISSWWVNDGDPTQFQMLYVDLSEYVVERLSSLLGNDARERIGEPQTLVLYLLDARRRHRRRMSLAVLESTILLELAGGNRVAGVDLRVAHGSGVGSSPIEGEGMSQTMPMPLAATGRESERQPSAFVRETVSPANVKWNRRASDRAVLQDAASLDHAATVTSWMTVPEGEHGSPAALRRAGRGPSA